MDRERANPDQVSAAPPALVVEVQDGTGGVGAGDLAWLSEAGKRAGAALGVVGSFRVRVVNDTEMSAAHQRYSGVAGTTDVLTFDLSETGQRVGNGVGGAGVPITVDADVMVCLDEASRRGAEFGHGARRELMLYIVHGLLHCLGYDDHDEASASAMHEREDRVLEAIGVGATYEPARAVGRGGVA
ncbi:MAG: rRNA maturation RNase YbeY [Phycisphaeraceae bacterium]|nr:MAG: rRNA maturation RNase YbeY [Phycisphaeraceae bacterium]